MSYASTGTIQAADFNALAWGGTQGTYTASPVNIAYVLGVGSGAFGYGQVVTNLNTISAAGIVTATQWSGLLTSLNVCVQHQSGAAAAISVPTLTSGATATYSAALNTAVTTINTNSSTFTAQGATTTGATFSPVISAATGVAYAAVFATRTVTFASGDAARYFFNAGGQLNLVIISSTNNATARSVDVSTLLVTNVGGMTAFRNVSNGGRTGTGGTLNTNSTTIGYQGLTTGAVSLIQVTSTTAAYTTDYAQIQMLSSAQNVSAHGDKGAVVSFNLYLNAPTHALNAVLSVTLNHRVDIVYPETTYLVSQWGTPVVA